MNMIEVNDNIIEMKCCHTGQDAKSELTDSIDSGYSRLNDGDRVFKPRFFELLDNLKNISSRIKFYVLWSLVLLLFINAIIIFLHFYSTGKIVNKAKSEPKHVIATTHTEVVKLVAHAVPHFVFAEEDSWRDNDKEELSEDTVDNNALNRGKRQLRRNL